MNYTYTQILMQWLFLFVIMAIVVIPALMFRKIAQRNNKTGWKAFVLGLLVGGLALQIARVPLLLFNKQFLGLPETYRPYIGVFFIVGIGFTIDFIAIRIYRKKTEG